MKSERVAASTKSHKHAACRHNTDRIEDGGATRRSQEDAWRQSPQQYEGSNSSERDMDIDCLRSMIREGKGREGKGREGKGREGKGRERRNRRWLKPDRCSTNERTNGFMITATYNNPLPAFPGTHIASLLSAPSCPYLFSRFLARTFSSAAFNSDSTSATMVSPLAAH